MRRRQFISYSVATAGFTVASGLLRPQSANAFLFLLLRGALINTLTSYLLQGAFALARSALSQRSSEWYARRRSAQLAQEIFLARQFRTVGVAEVNTSVYNYVLAAQSSESLGVNPAFAFSGVQNRGNRAAYFAGPSCVGMAVASEYLAQHERLSASEIQAAILPREQDYSDFGGWSDSTSFTTYRTVASDSGVEIRYDAVDPRPGGYGVVNVVVYAQREIVIPSIEVQFPHS